MEGDVYHMLTQSALPHGWNYAFTRDGRAFFINEYEQTTTWINPVTGKPVQSGHHPSQNLPTGWEYSYTKDGIKYYIDHKNKITTFVNPMTGIPEAQQVDPSDHTKQSSYRGRQRVFSEKTPSSPTSLDRNSVEELDNRPLSGAQTYPSVNAELVTQANNKSFTNSPLVKKDTTLQRRKHKRASIKRSSTSSTKKQDGPSRKVRDLTAEVSMEGWLYRWEGNIAGIRSFKKKYFVLSEFCIYAYKDQNQHEILNSVLLPGYKMIQCSDFKSNKKFVFKAEHNNPSMKPIYFACDHQSDLVKWLDAMSMAGMAQKKSQGEFEHGRTEGDGTDSPMAHSNQSDQLSGGHPGHTTKKPLSPLPGYQGYKSPGYDDYAVQSPLNGYEPDSPQNQYPPQYPAYPDPQSPPPQYPAYPDPQSPPSQPPTTYQHPPSHSYPQDQNDSYPGTNYPPREDYTPTRNADPYSPSYSQPRHDLYQLEASPHRRNNNRFDSPKGKQRMERRDSQMYNPPTPEMARLSVNNSQPPRRGEAIVFPQRDTHEPHSQQYGPSGAYWEPNSIPIRGEPRTPSSVVNPPWRRETNQHPSYRPPNYENVSSFDSQHLNERPRSMHGNWDRGGGSHDLSDGRDMRNRTVRHSAHFPLERPPQMYTTGGYYSQNNGLNYQISSNNNNSTNGDYRPQPRNDEMSASSAVNYRPPQKIQTRTHISERELNSKSHEELTLLLIELHREESQLKTCIESAFKKLSAAKQELNIQPTHPGRHEQIRRDVDGLYEYIRNTEKQVELQKPLIQIVENFIQGNRTIRRQDTLNRSLQPQSPSDFNTLENKKKQLQISGVRIQQQKDELEQLNNDLRLLESDLISLNDQLRRSDLQLSSANALLEQRYTVERDIIQTQKKLVQVGQYLEQNQSQNSQLQEDVVFLRSTVKSAISMQPAKSMPLLQHNNVIPRPYRPVEDYKSTYTHTDKIMKSLQKQKHVLNQDFNTIRNNDERNRYSTIEMRPKRADQRPRPKSFHEGALTQMGVSQTGNGYNRGTYMETDIDTMSSRDLAVHRQIQRRPSAPDVSNDTYASVNKIHSFSPEKPRSIRDMKRASASRLDSRDSQTNNIYDPRDSQNGNRYDPRDSYAGRESPVFQSAPPVPEKQFGAAYPGNDFSAHHQLVSNRQSFNGTIQPPSFSEVSAPLTQVPSSKFRKPASKGQQRRKENRARYMTISSSEPLKLEATSIHRGAPNSFNTRDNIEVDRSNYYDERMIDSQLLAPEKVHIPERYIPDSSDEDEKNLNPAEQRRREEKTEQIRKLVAKQSLQEFTQDEIGGGYGQPVNARQINEETKRREFVLELRHQVAKEVTKKSKHDQAVQKMRSKSHENLSQPIDPF